SDLGHRFCTSHPARLRNEQVRDIHQLIDLVRKTKDPDILMLEHRTRLQLFPGFVIVSEANDNLHFFTPGCDVLQKIDLFDDSPSASHDEHGRHVPQLKTLKNSGFVTLLPEVRVYRKP